VQSKSAERLFSWAMNGFAILILVLAVAITLQVIFSFFNINPIINFAEPVWVLGNALTINSLLDFQWHVLCVIGLLPAGIVWLRDMHVRVDFLYSRQSERAKAFTELIGHVFFALPFLFMSIPAAWAFMMSAYNSNQGSSNDGLNELFLVKAILPIGLTLIALVMLVDVVQQIRKIKSQ